MVQMDSDEPIELESTKKHKKKQKNRSEKISFSEESDSKENDRRILIENQVNEESCGNFKKLKKKKRKIDENSSISDILNNDDLNVSKKDKKKLKFDENTSNYPVQEVIDDVGKHLEMKNNKKQDKFERETIHRKKLASDSNDEYCTTVKEHKKKKHKRDKSNSISESSDHNLELPLPEEYKKKQKIKHKSDENENNNSIQDCCNLGENENIYKKKPKNKFIERKSSELNSPEKDKKKHKLNKNVASDTIQEANEDLEVEDTKHNKKKQKRKKSEQYQENVEQNSTLENKEVDVSNENCKTFKKHKKKKHKGNDSISETLSDNSESNLLKRNKKKHDNEIVSLNLEQDLSNDDEKNHNIEHFSSVNIVCGDNCSTNNNSFNSSEEIKQEIQNNVNVNYTPGFINSSESDRKTLKKRKHETNKNLNDYEEPPRKKKHSKKLRTDDVFGDDSENVKVKQENAEINKKKKHKNYFEIEDTDELKSSSNENILSPNSRTNTPKKKKKHKEQQSLENVELQEMEELNSSHVDYESILSQIQNASLNTPSNIETNIEKQHSAKKLQLEEPDDLKTTHTGFENRLSQFQDENLGKSPTKLKIELEVFPNKGENSKILESEKNSAKQDIKSESNKLNTYIDNILAKNSSDENCINSKKKTKKVRSDLDIETIKDEAVRSEDEQSCNLEIFVNDVECNDLKIKSKKKNRCKKDDVTTIVEEELKSEEDEFTFDADVIRENMIEAKDEEEVEIHKQVEKLMSLQVIFPYEIPQLHLQETRSTRPPKNLKQTLDELGITVKTSIFTKQEDDQIMKNFSEFCKLHNLEEDPRPFLKVMANRGRTSGNFKMNFIRFLAHRLNDRLISSVYGRFQRLHATDATKGRYTPKEDNLILDYMGKTNSKNPFMELASVLKRDRGSIEKRYRVLMRDEEGKQRVNWDMDLTNIFIKRLLKITKSEDVEDLRNITLTSKQYKKLSKKMGISVRKIRTAWIHSIYPKLFAKEIKLNKIKTAIFNDLYKSNMTDWKTVNWQKYSDMYPGYTAASLRKIIKFTVDRLIPENIRDNLKEAMGYFMHNELKVYRTFLRKIPLEHSKFTDTKKKF